MFIYFLANSPSFLLHTAAEREKAIFLRKYNVVLNLPNKSHMMYGICNNIDTTFLIYFYIEKYWMLEKQTARPAMYFQNIEVINLCKNHCILFILQLQ